MYSHKHWLKEVAKYYGIAQREVVGSRRTHTRAKSTYYFLLLKLGFDLYKVSEEIGKDRTTIVKFIDNSLKRENNPNRDKEAEDYLLKGK